MKSESHFFKGYNSAGSSSVKIVKEKIELLFGKNEHFSISMTGVPNSVIIVRRGDEIVQERYYDENGNPYLDIDYSDHGNPKKHHVVPYEHIWIELPNGKLKRDNWRKIQ